MARINPDMLRRQREKLGLSMDDLAERTRGISKKTIFEIENGKRKRWSSQNVIDKLAQALKITEEELVSVEAKEAEVAEVASSSRSQMNVRIADETRNAFNLVARRYGIRPVEIIEFAPLLFHIAAEESLKERRDRLQELQARLAAVAELDGNFPHITERLVNDWDAEEICQAEERSIGERDIRGELLDKSSYATGGIRRIGYDEGEHNPFVTHLRERLAAIGTEGGAGGEIREWSGAPSYTIGKAEALGYFGNDAEIVEHVLSGLILIHEIPKEHRPIAAVEARVAWARGRMREMEERERDQEFDSEELLKAVDQMIFHGDVL